MEPTPPSAPIKTTKTIVVPMKIATYSARIDTQSRKRRVRVQPMCRSHLGVPSWAGFRSLVGRNRPAFAQRGAEVRIVRSTPPRLIDVLRISAAHAAVTVSNGGTGRPRLHRHRPRDSGR
jgi:hypothetical protein